MRDADHDGYRSIFGEKALLPWLMKYCTFPIVAMFSLFSFSLMDEDYCALTKIME